jgi:hypothetical protein
MATAPQTLDSWLAGARIPIARLTAAQRGLLQAAFHFRQSGGDDYYSTRLLSHFLLHCHSGLKVAAIARLLGISRPTASRQQGLSSKEALQQAHHRMDGRPYGKLLPRYAGPLAEYLFAHPKASRADLIDFIDRTWSIRVSRIALYHYLKKYGLDQTATGLGTPATPTTEPPTAGAASAPPLALPPPQGLPELPAGRPVPTPAPPFSPRAPSTRAPSSSSRRR